MGQHASSWTGVPCKPLKRKGNKGSLPPTARSLGCVLEHQAKVLQSRTASVLEKGNFIPMSCPRCACESACCCVYRQSEDSRQCLESKVREGERAAKQQRWAASLKIDVPHGTLSHCCGGLYTVETIACLAGKTVWTSALHSSGQRIVMLVYFVGKASVLTWAQRQCCEPHKSYRAPTPDRLSAGEMPRGPDSPQS